MSIEATAEALVTDTPVTPDETPQEAPETPMSEDDMLSAAFDKLQEEPEEDETPDPAPVEEVEASEAEEEPETAEAVEDVEPAPSDLPRGVRDAWKDIPESAREALTQSHREMTAKLGEQGRMMQGIAPIRDVLTEAVKTMPHLADMTPQQVARDVFQLAELSQDFRKDPVNTLVGYAKQHGIEGQLAAALNGQEITQETQQVANLNNQIRHLQNKIEQMSDPEYLRSQVNQYTNETQVVDAVTQFAQTAEHWETVENHMPAAIQFTQAKLGEGASTQDVLSQAYELAVSQFVPNQKAKPQDAPEVSETVNPEKTKAQIRAKSVNVKSTPVSKAKPVSEDELLSQTFDKLQN